MPSWDFYRLGPGDYEQILAEHDVLIFSDVEARLFQLMPVFFDRAKFGKKPLTFPDRCRLTIQAVERGMGIMLLGGWLSFTGEIGKGGWGRTPLKEIMPVECLDIEDLCESTEGWTAEALVRDHPLFDGVELSTLPPILGYNIVRPRAGCPVLARWSGTSDPMAAVGRRT